MITDVPGVRVGHWTGDGTGVTVVVFPAGTVGSGEVRGGAPATRETALLEPGRTVEHVDAIVLTGGSAFGLATADGVMRALAEHGPRLPDAGRAGADRARGGDLRPRRVRRRAARTRGGSRRARRRDGRADRRRSRSGGSAPARGATVGKWRGGEHAVPGGLGSASARDGDVVVGALAVVNAVGDVIGDDGRMIAGLDRARPARVGFPEVRPVRGGDQHDAGRRRHRRAVHEARVPAPRARARTTGSPGRSTRRTPATTATSRSRPRPAQVDAHLDRLRVLATDVTAEAVRSAVA